MNKPDAEYFHNPRAEMLAYIPRGAKKILDVGCAAGAFGQLMRESGAEVWGVEAREDVAALASERLDRVIPGNAEEIIKSMTEKFDCVVFNDVLEHMADPFEVLNETKRILSPGGVVVASIPNVRYIVALGHILIKREFRYSDSGIFDRTHLRWFTQKSIRRTFAEAGYEILRLEGMHPVQRLPLRLAIALSFGFLSDTRWLQFAVVAARVEMKRNAGGPPAVAI